MWLGNLNIWDGVSDQLSENCAIEIDGGKVITVANSDDIDPAICRDMNGLFVIPGLIDAHVHMCLDPDITDPFAHGKVPREQQLQNMQRRAAEMLGAGITTARDLGGGQWLELEIRDRINSGEVIGSRLWCAGQPITSVAGHCHFWGGEAADIDAAAEVIARQVEHRVDLIKIMATGGNITPGSAPVDSQFDAATMTEIVAIANAKNYTVAAHCHGLDGIQNASTAGVDTIEHCSWVGENGWGQNYDADTAQQIADKGIWVSPTINANWRRFIGSPKFESTMQSNYRKMRAAGVKLIASTDAGIPNVRHHHLPQALPMLAHFAELSNVETLRAATSDCAQAIGLGELVGQIKMGFEADLVFYEYNPLEDLKHLEKPALVMSRGLFVD